MDSGDGDGFISMQELLEGLRSNPDLQALLSAMGVTSSEVEGLFILLDDDGDGLLDNAQFVDQFSSMKTHIERTTTFYILKYVERIFNTMEIHGKALENIQKQLGPIHVKVASEEMPAARKTQASVAASEAEASVATSMFFRQATTDTCKAQVMLSEDEDNPPILKALLREQESCLEALQKISEETFFDHLETIASGI